MRIRCLAAVAIFVAPLGDLSAGTLKVPKQFATIQAAVDTAVDGDDIEISKGTYAPFTVSGKDDITIRGDGDVVIDGDGATAAITITSCERITIEKLEAFDAFTLIDLDDVIGFTIRKCKLYMSFACVEASASRSGRIEENKIKESLFGCSLDLCVAISIRENEFKELGTAIQSTGYLSTFESNDFSNVSTGISILGTSVTSFGMPVPALPTVVRDNVMENDPDYVGAFGSGADDAGIFVGVPNAGILIADNEIKRPLNDGIVTETGVQSVLVIGNKVKKANRYGIVIASILTLVHDNTVSNCQQDGVRLVTDGDGCSVSHNEVEKCGGFGFVFASTANSVVRNTARDNALGSVSDSGTSSYQDNDFEP